MKIHKVFDSYRKRLKPPYSRKALLFIVALLLIALIIPLNILLFSHAGKSAATPTVKVKNTAQPTSASTSMVPGPTATQGTSTPQPTPTQTIPTYADYGSQAIKNMLNDFYINGLWKSCMVGCTA
jgi:hypothetical protein